MYRVKHVSFSALALLIAAGCAQEDVAATETSQSATGSDGAIAPTPTNTLSTPTDTGTPTATTPVGTPGPTGTTTPTTTANPTTTATGTTATVTGTATMPGPTGTMDPVPTVSGDTGTTAPPVGSTGTTDPVPTASETAPPATSGAGGTPEPMASTPVVPEGIDPATFAPDIDGFYLEGTCTGRASKDRECSLGTVTTGANWGTTGIIKENNFKVNGEAGKKYLLNLDVRGVVGSRCYQGGMRRSTAEINLDGPNDALYVGGTPGGEGWWNTYEIHVENPQVAGEANDFYLNAFEQVYNNTDYEKCNAHESYEINYKFDLPVMGDSTVRFRLHDNNGNGQMNCGLGSDTDPCLAPRTVDLSGMTPAATFSQPPINQAGTDTFYPQWVYFDVVSVTEVP